MSPVRGLGLDVVDVERIAALLARHPRRFLERVFRPGEVHHRDDPGALAQHVAGLFAAKEAVLKALGTGWGHGVAFRHIEVFRNSDGQPHVRLHDAAADRARRLGAETLHLSISHERGVAAAVAVLEESRS